MPAHVPVTGVREKPRPLRRDRPPMPRVDCANKAHVVVSIVTCVICSLCHGHLRPRGWGCQGEGPQACGSSRNLSSCPESGVFAPGVLILAPLRAVLLACPASKPPGPRWPSLPLTLASALPACAAGTLGLSSSAMRSTGLSLPAVWPSSPSPLQVGCPSDHLGSPLP